MPGAASFLLRHRGSRRQAGRPRTLAHFLTASRSLWLALTPTPTHTRSHTHSHPAAPRSLTRLACGRARARPRSHTARATLAEAVPRCPRPRRRVQSPGARPGPALQTRLRGGRGAAAGGARDPAGHSNLSKRIQHLLRDPPSRSPGPTGGHSRRPLRSRRGDGARAGRETGARESFVDALSPPAPKPSSLRKGNGWGARFVPYSKPRD